jgi:prevent-host-death family protein
MRAVEIPEARAELSSLIAHVERTGEDVVLTRNGRPAARLSPIGSTDRTAVADPVAGPRRVKDILAHRDARPPEPGFDDLSWDELRRIARGEDRFD